MATIALVDDDRNILTSVSIALESEGYRVETFTDGASALEGLTFATLEVVRGQWRYVAFAVPPRGETRFRRIDLESRWVPERPGARPPVIQVTKVTER